MTPLRQRMLEDMQLRGLSARTQGCYVAAVRQLAAHYETSPASLKRLDAPGLHITSVLKKGAADPHQPWIVCAEYLLVRGSQWCPVRRQVIRCRIRRVRSSG